jgi:predicted alpha/beta superfamily hydrolase
MREMGETLRATFRRVLRLENRRRDVRRGRLDRIAGFRSELLDDVRDVLVYVPPGYDEHPQMSYPLLVLHDGQNLFEAERSFAGQHWRVREAADEAIGLRRAEPMIIVGIDHGRERRIDEYTPVRDEERSAGGSAAMHARMLLEELLPVIAAGYRVRTDAGSVAVGGSSLGGLVSLYLALEHSDRFGRAIVMSPSIWWSGREILRRVDAFSGRVHPRLWVDVGMREGEQTLGDARELAARLRARGWNDTNLRFHEDRRGDHSEAAWARRIKSALEFLFPPI